MEQPLKDLADADAASRLAGDLTSLRVMEFQTPDRDSLSSWGLSPPLYRVTLSDAKGKATTVEFGSTRSDGNSLYARRESQVFTVGTTIVEEFSREAEAYRDTRLVRFDRAKASTLEGTFGDEHIAISRGKDGGWVASGKPVLAGSADDLMTAILDLKSRAFADQGEAQSLAAQAPSASVRVASAEGEPWEIKVYAGAGDPSATVSGRPGAFRLSANPTDALRAAFRKAAAGPVPTAAPTRKP